MPTQDAVDVSFFETIFLTHSLTVFATFFLLVWPYTHNSPRDVAYLVRTLGIRTIIDLRSKEESSGDIGSRLIYHHFVDEDASKIVGKARQHKHELGDVFVSPKLLLLNDRHVVGLTGSATRPLTVERIRMYIPRPFLWCVPSAVDLLCKWM